MKKINIELEVEEKENALFLHKEVGKGTYGNKKVRVLLTNSSLIVEVSEGKDKWNSFIIPISQLSEKLIKALVK